MSLVRQNNFATRHNGMILIVVLVLLGVFTLIVAALVRTSNINFRIVGNQQYRQEASLAAQNGIETYLSNPANFSSPLPALQHLSMDLDGDGTTEYTADVPAATCISVKQLDQQNDLDIANPNDADCFGTSSVENSGVISDNGAGSNTSICSNVTWDVAASVNDTATTGTKVTVHQGIAKRQATVSTYCP